MTENHDKHITQKLVNQTALIHSLKRYNLHDYYVFPILDEYVECYYTAKDKLFDSKIVDGAKKEIDLTIMMKILKEIRAMTDDEFVRVANNIHTQFHDFNATKQEEIEKAESHHKEHKLNELAKKNNAYLHLCEVFSILTIERLMTKEDELVILDAMSTGVLTFVLKTAIEKETDNESEFHFNSGDLVKDAKAMEEHVKFERIVKQIESVLKQRKQTFNDDVLHDYEEQIKEEEKHRLENVED